ATVRIEHTRHCLSEGNGRASPPPLRSAERSRPFARSRTQPADLRDRRHALDQTADPRRERRQDRARVLSGVPARSARKRGRSLAARQAERISYAGFAQASAASSRSLPQNNSSPIKKDGAPTAPLRDASSVCARSLSLTVSVRASASGASASTPRPERIVASVSSLAISFRSV